MIDFISLSLCLGILTNIPKYSSSNESVILKKQFCSVETTESLLKYGREHYYANKIPKIIHYVYKTGYIPTQYSSHVKNCIEINKDVKFVFWNDFLAYRFIINHFQYLAKIYSSYFRNKADMLKISDSIRYIILYKFGGIYMDLDTKCQKPFDVVMVNSSCILSQEVNEQTRILWNLPYLAVNSLMASTTNHNFFKYVVGKLTKEDGSYVLHQTGPIFLTNLFESYQKLLQNNSDQIHSVTLADPYMYAPHTDGYLESYCSNPDGEWKIKGCQTLSTHRRLQNIKRRDAIAVHLFMHLGHSFAKGNIRQMDNICILFRNISLVYL